MNDSKKIREYAEKCYSDVNSKYGDGSYMIHIDIVEGFFIKHATVFKNYKDYLNTRNAIYCHDLIEDARQSLNDIKEVAGRDVALIVLSVTDVPAENRLMKHLLTMGKTVQDYRGIILKMCDIWGNASHSKAHGDRMYDVYVEEYAYRRPIFMKALKWYKDVLHQDELDKIWEELDEIHKYKKQ